MRLKFRMHAAQDVHNSANLPANIAWYTLCVAVPVRSFARLQALVPMTGLQLHIRTVFTKALRLHSYSIGVGTSTYNLSSVEREMPRTTGTQLSAQHPIRRAADI